MSLFFVAPDAYSRSLCEFFSVANENSFFITEPNEDNIIQQLFRAVLSLAWQFASISSPAGVSLNTSNKDHSEKNDPHDIRSVLFNVLNDKLVADLIGLVPAHLLRSYSLQYAPAI